MKKEKMITSKELSQKVNQSESYVIELCESDFIEGTFFNDEWLISENAQLPCVKYLNLFNLMDQEKVKILKGDYKAINTEELAHWIYGIYHDNYYFGFDRLTISKGTFKYDSGEIHQKYILSTEMISSVAEWKASLEKIFIHVKNDLSRSSTSQIDSVFDTLEEVYKYAQLIYGEIPLLEYIVNMRTKVLDEKARQYFRCLLKE